MSDLTTAEVAKILKLSTKRVTELAERGQLKARKPSTIWLFNPDDVAAFKKLKRPRGRPPKSKRQS